MWQGKRDPSGSVGGAPAPASTAQRAGGQPAEWLGSNFLSANEAALAAWEALPKRYKERGLKQIELDIIELGGAPNYEKKKKVVAA
jgi:hypothetical protein